MILGSIDSLLKRIRKTGMVQVSGYWAAVDHIHCIAVEDLVLSQGDEPKGTDQLVRFHMKLSFSIQVCTR